jgi:isocitrate/isopropylmalate dehydrogenase
LTDGMFLEEARRARDACRIIDCGIDYEELIIDAAFMRLVKDPSPFDVILCENLYGDLVSDLCAQMVGGLGFGCSGNIGDKLAVFEPTHGSAPKHAGQYRCNPIAILQQHVQ